MDATLEELCVQQETEDQNYEMYSVHFFLIFQQTAVTIEFIGEKKTKLCAKDQTFHGNNIDLGLKLEPNDKRPETKNPKIFSMS